MKRYGNLYTKISKRENLIEAIHQASRGKHNRKSVQKVLGNVDYYTEQLQQLLNTESFIPAKIHERVIYEKGKQRIITSTPFYPDQVVHWAIMLVVQPILLNGMYEYTLATIKNRGAVLGKKKVEQWIRHDFKNTKYTLKMDITKFYSNIDKEILKHKLSNKFKDKQLLSLLNLIIESYHTGLPLGLYISQWLANFYLTDIDHFVKNNCRVKYYLRYMDDMVMFDSNKRRLKRIHQYLVKKLQQHSLTEKPNWQVFRTSSRPLDFLGYKFYRTHTTLRKRNYLKITQTINKVKNTPLIKCYSKVPIY